MSSIGDEDDDDDDDEDYDDDDEFHPSTPRGTHFDNHRHSPFLSCGQKLVALLS